MIFLTSVATTTQDTSGSEMFVAGTEEQRKWEAPLSELPTSVLLGIGPQVRFETEVLARIGGCHGVIGCVGPNGSLEYVGGGSLRERISVGRLIDRDNAVKHGLQLFEAVEHCHAHGIIHRDIKPSNILFTEDGELRLIDFDVAAYRGARSTLPGYEDVRIGTLPYSAPEQILDPATATYETADIFSLGVVLYEMLTGRIPFPMTDEESEEEYRARLPYEDPVPPRTYRPDLPAEIEAVILKAMARDPAARYQTVAELREDLEAAVGAAGPPSLHAAPPPRGQLLAWAGLGVALAALLAWIFAGA